MPAQMVVELPGGGKVLFGGSGATAPLSQVSRNRSIAQAIADKLEAAMGTLGSLVSTLEHTVGQLKKRPDKIEMEFGASLTGECDLWIVSGTGEAEFKVTLTWGKE